MEIITKNKPEFWRSLGEGMISIPIHQKINDLDSSILLMMSAYKITMSSINVKTNLMSLAMKAKIKVCIQIHYSEH